MCVHREVTLQLLCTIYIYIFVNYHIYIVYVDALRTFVIFMYNAIVNDINVYHNWCNAACALRFFKTKSALRFVVCAHTHARLERGGRVRRLRSTRTAVSIWNTFTQSPIVFLVLGLWQLCDSLVRKRIFLKGVKSCGMVKWTVRAQRSGVGGTSQLVQYYNINQSYSTFSSLTSVLQIVLKLAESENGKEGNTWKKLFLVSSTWDSIGVHT